MTPDRPDPLDGRLSSLTYFPRVPVFAAGSCGVRLREETREKFSLRDTFCSPPPPVLKVLGEISFQPRHFGLIDNSSAAFFADESKTPNLG